MRSGSSSSWPVSAATSRSIWVTSVSASWSRPWMNSQRGLSGTCRRTIRMALPSTAARKNEARFHWMVVVGTVDLIINGSFWVGTALGSGASLILLDKSLFATDVGSRIARQPVHPRRDLRLDRPGLDRVTAEDASLAPPP
jgi:hypothetical protein